MRRPLRTAWIATAAAVAVGVAAAAAFALLQPRVNYSRSSQGTLVHVFTPDTDYWLISNKIREAWVAADGSGRVDEVVEVPSFPSENDRAKWVAAGQIGPKSRSDMLPAGDLTYFTDADVRRLIDSVSADAPGESLDRLASVLSSTAGDPDTVRSAIAAFEQLASVSGTVTGETVTLEGLSADAPSVRYVLTFDQARGRLLRYQQFLLDRAPGLAMDPPVMRLDVRYQETEMVGAQGQVP